KGGIAEALEVAKVRADVFTSTLTQRALWRFMDGPAYARHLRSSRALYRERRDAFVDALGEAVPWARGRAPAARVHGWVALPGRFAAKGGVRGGRGRGGARHAGRAVLSDAQRPAGLTTFIRPFANGRGARRRRALRPRALKTRVSLTLRLAALARDC